MKIPEGVKNILCVCTAGKDRSPIMAEYFQSLGYEARSVGISEYHTKKAGTNWADYEDAVEADLIVVVSTVHEAFIRGLLRAGNIYREPVNREIRVVPLEGAEPHSPIVAVPDFREWVLGVMRESFPVSQEVSR